MKQQNRRTQHGRILGHQNTRARRLLQQSGRRRVEDFRRGRAMHQLQILGDELDIDEPAGGVLEIPPIGIALFRSDRAAHFDDVGRRPRSHPPAADHLADRRFDPRGECRRSADDHARTRQRQCSQVQASRSW